MAAPKHQTPIRIVICGFGEIATKAHLPAIQLFKSNFQLVAIVDPHRELALKKLSAMLSTTTADNTNIPVYSSLSDCLLKENNKVDAVAICTPSSVTLDLALIALQAHKHVLVEKPPGDWRRLQGLQLLAQKQQLTFFTAYHTAACVGYPCAQKWIQQQTDASGSLLQRVHVTWKENVKKWHPGQIWVTQKNSSDTAVQGCEGVLDMVFNPVSLLVALLLQQNGDKSSLLTFQSSHLVIPSNWETPIAGSFTLSYEPKDDNNQNDRKDDQNSQSIPVTGDFAWDYQAANANEEDEEIWTIEFQSTKSSMKLTDGGSQVYINDKRVTTQPTATYPLQHEYENLYQTFAELIAHQQCLVDDTTPQLLEDIQTRASFSECPEYHI